MTSPSPAVRRRQQQVARIARRTPGLVPAVDRGLHLLRRNATLTDLFWRVFVPDTTLGARPVALHPGRRLTGRDVVFLPVVGVLGLGLTDEQAEALLQTVADLQAQERSFKPLLILDRPVLGAARRHGVVVELITPQEDWPAMPGGSDDPAHWLEHVGRRVAGIVEHYQVLHLARAGADGLDPLDLAVVRALAARLPAGLDVRLVEEDR